MQNVQDIHRELSLARMENEQLKLDGLRQRKQNSILRLKLASAKEDVDLLQRNMALLDQHGQRLVEDIVGLRNSLAAATQQLTDVAAAKAMVQADAERHQVSALPITHWAVKCCSSFDDDTIMLLYQFTATLMNPSADGNCAAMGVMTTGGGIASQHGAHPPA